MEIFDIPEELQHDKVRVEQSVKQQQEFKMIGRVLRKPGLTLFSYNTVTGEMKEAAIERDIAMVFGGEVKRSTKVKIEPHCIYGQALNMKNWEKKIRKEYGDV